jgi:hypothetical protein
MRRREDRILFTLPGPGVPRKQGLRKKAIAEDLARRR